MKHFIPFLLVSIFSCNASDNKKKQVPNSPVQDSTQILQTADGTAINLIGGYEVTDTVNDYILFPLQVKDAKEKEDGSIRLYSKENGNGNMYWNIIFHNYKSGENTLLEPEKKILIGGYDYNNGYYRRDSYSAGKVETYKQSRYVFYTVYTDDYNSDKKLGTSDPAYFFISNPDGSGFKQVSPPGISITQKAFPKNNPFLLLSGMRDSNKDKKFDANDELVYYKVNMADSTFKTEEIFNQTFKIKLKKLFDKNWKN